MSIVSNQIVRPVKWNDLSTVLGVGGGLANKIKNASLNRWAKYKPFKSRQVAILPTDTFQQTSPFLEAGVHTMPAWVGEYESEIVSASGRNVQLFTVCGIKVPYITMAVAAIKAVIDGYATNGCNWPGASRTGWGQPNAWFRALDFAKDSYTGYYHQAYAPFYWSTKSPAYLDTNVAIQGGWEAEADNLLGGYDIIHHFFGDGWVVWASLYKGSTYIGEYDCDFTVDDGYFSLPIGRLTAGTYTAYLYLRKNDWVILLPTISGASNPLTIEVRNQTDPSTNPFNKLDYNVYDGGVSYTTYSPVPALTPYYENQSSIGEMPYVMLLTEDRYSFWVDFDNDTGSTVYVNWQLLSFDWADCGARGNGHPYFDVYINGARETGQYYFQPGRTRVYFSAPDIFYDPYTGTRNPYAGVSDHYFSDSLYMNYDAGRIGALEMDIHIDSSRPSFRGFFCSSYNPQYYTTR